MILNLYEVCCFKTFELYNLVIGWFMWMMYLFFIFFRLLCHMVKFFYCYNLLIYLNGVFLFDFSFFYNYKIYYLINKYTPTNQNLWTNFSAGSIYGVHICTYMPFSSNITLCITFYEQIEKKEMTFNYLSLLFRN